MIRVRTCSMKGDIEEVKISDVEDRGFRNG